MLLHRMVTTKKTNFSKTWNVRFMLNRNNATNVESTNLHVAPFTVRDFEFSQTLSRNVEHA